MQNVQESQYVWADEGEMETQATMVVDDGLSSDYEEPETTQPHSPSRTSGRISLLRATKRSEFAADARTMLDASVNLLKSLQPAAHGDAASALGNVITDLARLAEIMAELEK